MSPSYFGLPDAQLLGIHHAHRPPSRGVGVVLCPPAPLELVRHHWAFRRLAELLSKAGFDVLRFDYRGTGDSAGKLEDTTPAQWVDDIQRAGQELKDVAGVRKISAVGFRLGALLLAQAASQGLALETVVLWDPVVTAREWLERLTNTEEHLRRGMPQAPRQQPGELMGYVIPPALEAAWSALELTSVSAWAAQTAIVAVEQSPSLERLRGALERRSQPFALHLLAAEAARAPGALLGNEALEQISAVLGARR